MIYLVILNTFTVSDSKSIYKILLYLSYALKSFHVLILQVSIMDFFGVHLYFEDIFESFVLVLILY